MSEEQDRIERKQLQVKFARACAQVDAVTKSDSADTGKYSYSYTNLNDVLHVVKETLRNQELGVSQPLEITPDGNLVVNTIITDMNTGAYLMFSGAGVPLPKDPQAAGSAITYFRRYTLVSLMGIEQEDDDGGQASRAVTRPERRTGAEAEVRRLIGALPAEDQRSIQSDFTDEFGSTLTRLPESRHGDALSWVKWWIEGNETTDEPEEASDD